jgi:hypothetical protein
MEYSVTHSRKGKFSMRVNNVSGEWISGVITRGTNARALLTYNEKEDGDEITIRESLSSFTPIKIEHAQ